MTLSRIVSGVLGKCWVDSFNTTHVRTPYVVALWCCVSGVLGLSTRTRMRVCFKAEQVKAILFHASFKQPNTPSTLNKYRFRSLNLLVLSSVGYVLGCANSVLALLEGASQ